MNSAGLQHVLLLAYSPSYSLSKPGYVKHGRMLCNWSPPDTAFSVAPDLGHLPFKNGVEVKTE